MVIEIRTNTPEPKKRSKAKVEAQIAAFSDIGQKIDGPYDTQGVVNALFPDLRPDEIDKMVEAWTNGIILKHEKRLAYNAAYQRDLRTIKRLGLSVTVSQYRKSKET